MDIEPEQKHNREHGKARNCKDLHREAKNLQRKETGPQIKRITTEERRRGGGAAAGGVQRGGFAGMVGSAGRRHGSQGGEVARPLGMAWEGGARWEEGRVGK